MRRQVIRMIRNAPIDYCINRMIKYKINSILVIDDLQQPLGVVSKTDVMGAFYAGSPTGMPLENFMVGPPMFCFPDDELEAALDAMHQMLLSDVQRLFVHSEDPARIVGILSLSDAARFRSGSCRACTSSRLIQT